MPTDDSLRPRLERLVALAERALVEWLGGDATPELFAKHHAFRWEADRGAGRLVPIERPATFDLDDLIDDPGVRLRDRGDVGAGAFGGGEEAVGYHRAAPGGQVHRQALRSEGLDNLLEHGAEAKSVQRAARQQGMRLLREDGARQVVAGITTVDEVLAATQAGEG